MQRFGWLVSWLLLAPAALAQGTWLPQTMERSERWEASFQLLGQSSEDFGGPSGSGVSIDSDVGFGFGLTYNFNEHFALGGDFQFFNPDYNATLIDDMGQPVMIDAEADFFTGQFRGTWNFFKGPLTPYVEGGVGWTYADSNIIDQPPITGCWFDPWWGYICDTFFSTYDDTSFSYSIGGGVRWDITPAFGLRGGYSRLMLDFENASKADFDTGRLDLIWRF